MTSSERSGLTLSSRITGSLLACALGEAAAGTPDASVFGDATALTLYTVDGMTEALEWANDGVAADETACLWLAYLRWLGTQGEAPPSSAPAPPARWIDRQDVLHSRRRPDATTIRALRSGEMGSRQRPLERDDDGPGALQRSAPFGLIANVPPAMVEKLTLDAAAITHGNPAAQIPAAVFAGLIHGIAHRECPLPDAVKDAAEHAATLGAADLSVQLAHSGAGSLSAASATAGNILCAAIRLVQDTETNDDAAHVSALLTAAAEQDAPAAPVIGAVAGALIGALYGRDALPAAAMDQLKGAAAVEELAGRFSAQMGA